MDPSDLEVDLLSLGLGQQPLPAVDADDKGSFGSTMLSPCHVVLKVRWKGVLLMRVCLVVCSELRTHLKRRQLRLLY